MVEQLYLADVEAYEEWIADGEDEDDEAMKIPGPPPLPGQAGWISYYTRAANLVLESLLPEDEEAIIEHQEKWRRDGLPFEDQAVYVDFQSFRGIDIDAPKQQCRSIPLAASQIGHVKLVPWYGLHCRSDPSLPHPLGNQRQRQSGFFIQCGMVRIYFCAVFFTLILQQGGLH